MVNSADFTKRLEKIFDYYELNASSFAEAIDVGRSSISHILSGRNKPSLDFVMKIVSTYSEVDLYWLLNGKGVFPKSAHNEPQPSKQTSKPTREIKSLFDTDIIEPHNIQAEKGNTVDSKTQSKTISKVIVLYSDGSFEAFEN